MTYNQEAVKSIADDLKKILDETFPDECQQGVALEMMYVLRSIGNNAIPELRYALNNVYKHMNTSSSHKKAAFENVVRLMYVIARAMNDISGIEP